MECASGPEVAGDIRVAGVQDPGVHEQGYIGAQKEVWNKGKEVSGIGDRSEGEKSVFGINPKEGRLSGEVENVRSRGGGLMVVGPKGGGGGVGSGPHIASNGSWRYTMVPLASRALRRHRCRGTGVGEGGLPLSDRSGYLRGRRGESESQTQGSYHCRIWGHTGCRRT